MFRCSLLYVSRHKLKAVAIARELPSDVDNLMRMPDEVTDRIPDGCEHVSIEPLNSPRLEQLCQIQLSQGGVGLRDGILELGQQVSLRKRPAIREFERPVSHVARSADTVNDPLAHIAAQVQDNVLNTVVGFVR